MPGYTYRHIPKGAAMVFPIKNHYLWGAGEKTKTFYLIKSKNKARNSKIIFPPNRGICNPPHKTGIVDFNQDCHFDFFLKPGQPCFDRGI